MDIFLTSLLIGIGLSMDCLAVSFAVGAHQKSRRVQAALIVAIFFGGFQAGMTLLGWLLGTGFADLISSFDHWLAAALLFIIGLKMIHEGFTGPEAESSPDIFSFVPIVTLAIATSIDALAVGISYAFLQISPLIPSIIIGLVAAVFSVGGIITGGRIGHILGERVDILGGIILILIGIKIIIEHTNYLQI